MATNPHAETKVLVDEILNRVFDQAGFLSLTIRYTGDPPMRLRIRTIQHADIMDYQFESQRGTQSETTILPRTAAWKDLERRLLGAFRDAHLVTINGDLHVRRAKRGRLLSARSRPMQRRPRTFHSHDRVKSLPLTTFDSGTLLRGLGFTDASGNLRASMQSKYRQINAFLSHLDAVARKLPPKGPVYLVDGGCGKAYLTFSACCYLQLAHQRRVVITGLDQHAGRIQECRRLAEALAISDVAHFRLCDIADYQPETPVHIVFSLHACDTATDAVLAGGVKWGAKAILAAPCCQHNLHATLKAQGPMRGLMRHKILRQRQGDLLTDACRAQLLRVAGYRVTVQEFVDPDATARNVLLRAERSGRIGNLSAWSDYVALRDFWEIRPELETLLSGHIDLPAELLEGKTEYV